MSFYRSLLAACAALALAMPAFADEGTTTTTTTTDQTAATQETPAAAAAMQEAPAATDQKAAAQEAKVDVNKATMKQLSKVKGISSAQAKAIITYRKKNGSFKTLDDLQKVKAFKKLNADQLKEIQDQLIAD